MGLATHNRDLSCLSKRDRQFLSVSAEIAFLASMGPHMEDGGKDARERLETLISELNDEVANQDSSESTS
jgi:hypothetical protein